MRSQRAVYERWQWRAIVVARQCTAGAHRLLCSNSTRIAEAARIDVRLLACASGPDSPMALSHRNV